MKKNISFLLVFLFVASFVNAQSKDEKAVTEATDALKKALLSGNELELKAITLPQLSYGHSSGKVEDQDTFVETLVSRKSDFVSIDITNQSVKVTDNIAIVRHNLSAQTNDNGIPGSVKLGIMLVWKKEGGAWKLLARQAYKL